jgi:hypothetical protein
VINSYEREECVSDAQVARARLILALKEHGDERTKVEGRLAEIGFEAMARDLAAARAGQKIPSSPTRCATTPSGRSAWRSCARPTSTPRQAGHRSRNPPHAKINADIMGEFDQAREADEADFLMRKFDRMTDDEFIDEWVEEWVDRKGTTLAGNEFRLTELWYASRFCEGTTSPEGTLDHGRCDGHRDRIFETKADARARPRRPARTDASAIDEMNLEGRDPKDSGSGANSSDSSPTPSAAETSAPSTPAAIQQLVPGS